MILSNEANVDAIGVSGRYWIGFNEKPAFDLVIEVLGSARKYIRIATYSLGQKSSELERLFKILEGKIATGVKVQIIVNNFEKTNPYAKKKLKQLSSNPNFTVLNFKPKNKNENLHAKIISVDKKYVLIGSANMSRSGMFSNHEIIVKISGGKFASNVDNLLDRLAEIIFAGA